MTAVLAEVSSCLDGWAVPHMQFDGRYRGIGASAVGERAF